MNTREKAQWLSEFYAKVAEGGMVQQRPSDVEIWRDVPSDDIGPTLSSLQYLWRIKPEPREWVVYRGNTALYFDDENSTRFEKIKVREVIE